MSTMHSGSPRPVDFCDSSFFNKKQDKIVKYLKVARKAHILYGKNSDLFETKWDSKCSAIQMTETGIGVNSTEATVTRSN